MSIFKEDCCEGPKGKFFKGKPTLPPKNITCCLPVKGLGNPSGDGFFSANNPLGAKKNSGSGCGLECDENSLGAYILKTDYDQPFPNDYPDSGWYYADVNNNNINSNPPIGTVRLKITLDSYFPADSSHQELTILFHHVCSANNFDPDIEPGGIQRRGGRVIQDTADYPYTESALTQDFNLPEGEYMLWIRHSKGPHPNTDTNNYLNSCVSVKGGQITKLGTIHIPNDTPDNNHYIWVRDVDTQQFLNLDNGNVTIGGKPASHDGFWYVTDGAPDPGSCVIDGDKSIIPVVASFPGYNSIGAYHDLVGHYHLGLLDCLNWTVFDIQKIT